MDGRTVLIVEDELIAAVDLRNQLRRMGYLVSPLAKTGEEAVRLAAELHPDLVLMDVHLAGTMNGIEAARRIQQIKPIPVVYVTANADIVSQTASHSEGPCLCCGPQKLGKC